MGVLVEGDKSWYSVWATNLHFSETWPPYCANLIYFVWHIVIPTFERTVRESHSLLQQWQLTWTLTWLWLLGWCKCRMSDGTGWNSRLPRRRCKIKDVKIQLKEWKTNWSICGKIWGLLRCVCWCPFYFATEPRAILGRCPWCSRSLHDPCMSSQLSALSTTILLPEKWAGEFSSSENPDGLTLKASHSAIHWQYGWNQSRVKGETSGKAGMRKKTREGGRDRWLKMEWRSLLPGSFVIDFPPPSFLFGILI